MKVFEISALEGHEWVVPVNQQDFDLLRFDGRLRATSWTPIEMRTVSKDDHGRTLKYSDFPSCSGGDMLLFRERVATALAEVLRESGEVLPLNCPREPLWVLNVTRLIDGLDEKSSELLRAGDSGRILRVKKPVFLPTVLNERSPFKLAATPRGLIYATEAFVESVTAPDLKGIGFRQVWAAS